MSEITRDSEITVHYSESFQVSGKRILIRLKSIDGQGRGLRHSEHLILPILPIISKKSCGSGYQLLNANDTRISAELCKFNSETLLECLLINQNIELVKEVSGSIFPQLATHVPREIFLAHLAQSESMRKTLGTIFDCSTSHSNADFSVEKLAKWLGPNGPSKATINRILKKYSNTFGNETEVETKKPELLEISNNPSDTELITGEMLIKELMGVELQLNRDEFPERPSEPLPIVENESVVVEKTIDQRSTGSDQSNSQNDEDHIFNEHQITAKSKWCEQFELDPADFERLSAALISSRPNDEDSKRYADKFFRRILSITESADLQKTIEDIEQFLKQEVTDENR